MARKDKSEKGDPLWISRLLLNTCGVYEWGYRAGVRKMMPPDSIHMTLATVRTPVIWGDLELQNDELVIPAGLKTVQIFAFTIKALTFGDPRVKARHEWLVERFPEIDHRILRPHVSLYKGGTMPRLPYEGELVFGPERAMVFDAENAAGIKHIKLADHIKGCR